MPFLTRRDFLTGAGAVAGIGLGGLARAARATGGTVPLRPPGALAEPEFLAACIRCGQCVEACPYDTLHIAGAGAGTSIGTPYWRAEEKPCAVCRDHDNLKCIDACPSGALRPVASPADIRMGIAVIDHDSCLAWLGQMCRSCWYACPYQDEAITMDDFYRPVVVAGACIGCGLCTYACATLPTSIPIRPAGQPPPTKDNARPGASPS